MPVACEKPSRRKPSRAVREAGDRLLKAVKERILQRDGRVDYEALRRRGYREETLARLREL